MPDMATLDGRLVPVPAGWSLGSWPAVVLLGTVFVLLSGGLAAALRRVPALRPSAAAATAPAALVAATSAR